MDQIDIEILLVGGGKRALKLLDSLVERSDIGIQYFLIQEGREDEEQVYKQIQEIAAENDIRHETHPSGASLTDEQISTITSIPGDMIVGAGIWRSYLPTEILEHTTYGFIGNHGSLLPEYRGWANINWYMINGEDTYGIKAYKLNDEIDAGDIVYDRKEGVPVATEIEIGSEMYISDLLAKTRKAHVQQINYLLDLAIEERLVFIAQRESEATYGCHRGPEDGEIDWTDSTEDIYNFIRGQSEPYPGAYSYYRNEKFKIWTASIPDEMDEYVGRIPGKIVERHASGEVDVLTGDGILRIEKIGVGGETPTPRTFLTSVRETLGFDAKQKVRQLETKVDELEERLNGEQ
jgi:methionyl-tRNA formyltransferase